MISDELRMLSERHVPHYESRPIDPDSMLMALNYFEMMKGFPSWWSPHVSVDEDGFIVGEWWNQGRKMTVYFDTDTGVQFICIQREPRHSWDYDNPNPDTAETIWKWIARV